MERHFQFFAVVLASLLCCCFAVSNDTIPVVIWHGMDRENRVLEAMIKSKPELYMDEYQDWFQTITGTQISIATMCRSILRLGFTYKKLRIIAKQRSELARATYFRFVADIPQEMFLFIDETAKDKKKLQRDMGHFRPGLSSYVVGDFVREERYSVVAAMDINGIVATHTVPNAFNTEDFNFALENFIAPSIGRFVLGEPRSVVVMDNCRIHDSDVTINIIRQKGGIAVFLPPYSPDLNPIEYAFSLAKAILKRNRHVTRINPKYCMARALEEITPDDAQSFFTDSGYRY